MDFNPELLHNQEKKEAHLRRAATFMRWLEDPARYAKYTKNSVPEFCTFIDKLIVWALEMSMPKDDWTVFHTAFRDIKNKAFLPPDGGFANDEENYHACRMELIATLSRYSKHIEELYTQK